MKAIVTKYRGPTDTRGSRITASDEDGNRVVMPYDHALNAEGNHVAAADKLCAKMGWTGKRACGGIKGAYVYVFTE